MLTHQKSFKEMPIEEVVALYKKRRLVFDLMFNGCEEDSKCFRELTDLIGEYEMYIAEKLDIPYEEVEDIEYDAQEILKDLVQY